MNSTHEIGLVIVGDEILSGKRADKHMPKVIELLAARGLALKWARYAGDDRDLIGEEAHEGATLPSRMRGRQ